MAVTAPPRTNLNDRVYETLKQRLVRRELGPGEKVSLHALAESLGVSRSPVHHALTRLVAEGLLTVKSRRGYYVTPLTEAAIAEGYDVRLALELQAAELAVGRVARDGLRRFRELPTRPQPPSATRSGTRPTRPSTSTRSTWPATRSSPASTASSPST